MERAHRFAGREAGGRRDRTAGCGARMPRGGWGILESQVNDPLVAVETNYCCLWYAQVFSFCVFAFACVDVDLRLTCHRLLASLARLLRRDETMVRIRGCRLARLS